MPWCVYRANFVAGDAQCVAVVDRAEVLVGVRHSPQDLVCGMQQHRGVQRLAQFGCDGHVVVVAVGAYHRHHMATADRHHNGPCLMGGVEHHDLRVVAYDPDVVVDFPTAAVEFERAMGDEALNRPAVHLRTTTERSTSPAWILWNASSMSSRPMRSETNFSSGNLPCRYRLISVGKSRSGRQSPYHDDLSDPPREKKSMSGI